MNRSDEGSFQHAHTAGAGAVVGPDTALNQRFRSLDVSKRTFQPNTRRCSKTHGFRLRMRTRAGRAILATRRRKGRASLSA